MVKETITYVDFNGIERTEDFYFNLSQAERLEWQTSVDGGLSAMLERIIGAKDVPALYEQFKKLLLKAYGEKSPDGKRFIKSEELSTAFSQTEAYSQLYVKLATDAEAASKFVNALLANGPVKSEIPAAV